MHKRTWCAGLWRFTRTGGTTRHARMILRTRRSMCPSIPANSSGPRAATLSRDNEPSDVRPKLRCARFAIFHARGTLAGLRMNAVELHNVTKTFGRQTAVDDLSLVVPTGSVYGFIGPNGSGKTTTLRMIMRIFYPDSGSIMVLGAPHHAPADDRVGYLPEERGLYKQMKV